jgi:rRNA maturation endonuclease Nob1
MSDITVSDTYLRTMLQLAIGYHEELHEVLGNVTLVEDVESVQSMIESTEILINKTKGYLKIPILTYCEQSCDDCGEDVDEYMLCPDGAEICRDCFNLGRH